MTREKHPCSASVSSEGPWGSFNQHRCQKGATRFEEDKWWCTVHSPSFRESQQRKDKEKWEAKEAEYAEKYRRQTAIDKLVEGVSTDSIEQNLDILRDVTP